MTISLKKWYESLEFEAIGLENKNIIRSKLDYDKGLGHTSNINRR